ncbi:MAG TPA: hypothetical protein VJT80_11890 [Steroidobacteraceae bacterium]|nr:hypothetical protein [Steroidobacteraceae bacterium]
METAPLGAFPRLLMVTILVAVNLAGCGSLYLRDDSVKQATANAKAELDKVNLVAVFDDEAAYLDRLQQDENAAVAESLGAQRDRVLLTMLQGRPGNPDTRVFMAARIDGYLQAVAGKSDRGPGAKLWRLIDKARGQTRKPLADALAEVLKSDGSQVQGPKGVDNPELPSPSGNTLAQAIADSQAAVVQREKKQAEAKAAQETFQKQLKAAADDLAAGTARQETFTGLLAKFNELLKKAKDESNPYIGEFVSASLIEELDGLIAVTDPKGIDEPADSKARAVIGFVHAAFGVGDAFSDPPRVPHPNALAVVKAWLTYRANLTSADLAQAQAKEEVVHAKLAAVTEQVYYLSRAGDQLASIDTSPALEKGAGFARLVASNNAATRQAATGTLHYFASAWTKGFIPAQQLNEVAVPLIERRASLQQSRLAGEAWLGELKPAVATLAAYGEGGIDPHLIAELLQVLGISAIAVGVN